MSKINPFEQFPQLNTERLKLRRVTIKDREELLEITQHFKKDATQKDVDNILLKLDTAYENKSGINWGLTWNNELIGTCGYYRGFKNNTGEIGFVMRPVFRRKGFMEEALNCIIQFGYKQLELKTILAYTAESNAESIQLLNKLQFDKTNELDGRHRKYQKNRYIS